MRKLWAYALQWSTQGGWHLSSHVFLGILLTILILANYSFDFEHRYLNVYAGSWRGVGQFFLFYGVVYFLVLVVQGLLQHSKRWRQPVAWVKAGFFLLVLAINAGATFHYRWVYEVDGLAGLLQRWLLYLSLNLGSFILLVVPIALVWWFADRQYREGLYGLQRDGLVLRPYLLLLLIMLPLIVVAAAQPDFQATYPTWQANADAYRQTGWSPWWFTVSYQLAYGLDFLGVELLFRGALVIGMSRLLGNEAILPMVAVYCVLHFGKPMGEAISSVFGGYLLGIFALYSRNIWGGVLVHVGIAIMMEWAAILFQ